MDSEITDIVITYWTQKTPLVTYIYIVYSTCIAWFYLTSQVQECVYIQLIYVEMAWLWISISACYWLLFLWHFFGWVYVTIGMHLYEYCSNYRGLYVTVHILIIAVHPHSYNIVRCGFCVTILCISNYKVFLIACDCHWSWVVFIFESCAKCW